jgi:hypothetical protein
MADSIQQYSILSRLNRVDDLDLATVPRDLDSIHCGPDPIVHDAIKSHSGRDRQIPFPVHRGRSRVTQGDASRTSPEDIQPHSYTGWNPWSYWMPHAGRTTRLESGRSFLFPYGGAFVLQSGQHPLVRLVPISRWSCEPSSVLGLPDTSFDPGQLRIGTSR